MSQCGVRQLEPELQRVAREELHELPERLSADIEALRVSLKKQPHLRARTDSQFLVAFLRGCKFRQEKAKAKIEAFFTLKTKYPEMLSNSHLDMERTLTLLRHGVSLYLPMPLEGDGARIGIMRMGAYPLNQFSFVDILKVGRILQEITLLEDDYANVNGVIHILDMAEMTAGHLFQMTPTTMRRLFMWTEQAMPLRVKANHFINTPTGFEAIYNMIRPMLPEKQQQRLFVHGNNMDSLYAQLPQRYLPKEYGGANGSMPELIASWERCILEHRAYLAEDEHFGADAAYRALRSLDCHSPLGTDGTDGTFRQLSCD